jgi:hypothetical protein
LVLPDCVLVLTLSDVLVVLLELLSPLLTLFELTLTVVEPSLFWIVLLTLPFSGTGICWLLTVTLVLVFDSELDPAA